MKIRACEGNSFQDFSSLEELDRHSTHICEGIYFLGS